ncbi:MAG: pyruvate dehydrogenase E2 component (dihydrolipoamide acetyltransferase), partial [Flavobacteriales bacterium]
VDGILAILGEKGEDIKELLAKETATEPEVKEEPKKAAPAAEPKKETPAPSPVASASAAKAESRPSFQSASESGSERIVVSPLARRLAEERNINLKLVRGTGEAGRIVKRDIDNYQGGAASYTGVEQYRDEPVSQMRKVIAQRLSESKFTAPHFYLTVSVDMDNAIDSRNAINAQIAPAKISFNDLVIKACAQALTEHPAVNAAWHDDYIRYNDHVHIGVAVAVPDGLLVPVVRFANGKPLTEIGAEVRELASKAKSKKLQPADWEGNTFTISNLGMFDIEEFTAIVNPPDACILAVGGIQQVPVVKNGAVVPGNVMKLTLSCDHRVVDGVVGSLFLNTVKNYLQNPILLLGKASI